MKLPSSVDVVVVGGGIIGVSTAWFLASRGVSVALCEKAHIAAEQSSRNWGFVRKQGRDPLELPLMIHSLEIWESLAKSMPEEVGFTRGGTLYLSSNEKRYEANQAWLAHARTFDLDTRFLTLKELESLIPGIKGQTRGALYTPSDARAEPAEATPALAKLAREAGAMILEQTAVRGIETSGGAVSAVVTEHGSITTSTVVCAGGAWSSYFLRHLDVVFPQLKVIGSVMATHPGPLIGEQNIWSNGMGIRRRQDGGYTVAYGGSFDCDLTPDYFRFFSRFLPTFRNAKEDISLSIGKRFVKEWRWPGNVDFSKVSPFEQERILNPAPNLKLLNKAHENMKAAFPELRDVGIAQHWAGMIDATPDELPVISRIDSIPGLILSSGYSGHGFGIGPGAGKVTAELAMDRPTTVDISPFGFNRFL